MKRAPGAQQLIGQGRRVRPGQHEVVGNPLFPGALADLQRPSQPVPWPGVARPSGRIAIARHRSGSGSASQPRSSVSKTSGRSSCGKCPAPSISRHR